MSNNADRSGLEKIIESAILSSRWVLVIFYGGLAVALMLYSLHFMRELSYTVIQVYAAEVKSNEVLLKMLIFIDKTLVAILIVMVMLSGYENFISRFDLANGKQELSWLGKLDPGSVKIKLASSIVAISSIHLLKIYLDIEQVKEQWHILWLTIIHVVFLMGAIMLGYLGRISNHDGKD